jgi:hypothetical protein
VNSLMQVMRNTYTLWGVPAAPVQPVSAGVPVNPAAK